MLYSYACSYKARVEARVKGDAEYIPNKLQFSSIEHPPSGMSVGNNAWGPLRFDLLTIDMYTNVTPNVMQELGELSKIISFQG